MALGLGLKGLSLSAPAKNTGGGRASLFQQMLAANPSILFSAAQAGGLFQERTGASATTPTTVDGPTGSFKNWGSLGGWAVAPGDSARPTLRDVSGKRRIVADGFDDLLRILFTQSQPFVRVSAIAPLASVNGQHFFGGGTASSARLYQAGTSTLINSGNGLVAGTFATGAAVIEERHSGASGRVRINSGAYTEGNVGTVVSGGITFGATNADAFFSNCGLYASVAWVGSEPSSTDLALARAFCADAAGITL